MNILSVDALNEQIKNLLETTFIRTFVEGELSRVTYHNSGHIYFTLKDDKSSISCVMFRGNAAKLKFRLEEGLKVMLEGAVTVYKPRGQYQLNILSAEPSGQGALALAFEQLKARLQEQGYFNPEHKQALPRYIMNLALVTSETGAALQDMLRVASSRWPLVKISLYDVLVQGENAAISIARAIKQADANGHDAIVFGRGGGSMEDLWAFNEEILANAIYHCKTPTVSAVGHEIDWVISDFVADLRAPTPSAAMELILPDRNEILMSIDVLMQQLTRQQRQKLQQAAERITHLKRAMAQNSIENRLKMKMDELLQVKALYRQQMGYTLQKARNELVPLMPQLNRNFQAFLQSKKEILAQLGRAISAQDPQFKSKKGFAQVTSRGEIVALESLKPGDQVDLLDTKVKVSATVEKTRLLQ